MRQEEGSGDETTNVYICQVVVTRCLFPFAFTHLNMLKTTSILQQMNPG